DVLRKLLVLIGKPPAKHPVECKEKEGPPDGGPFDSVGCSGIDLIGLGFANDDLRAIEREVSELQVEALPVAVGPGGTDWIPEIALAGFGDGVNTVARAIG